MQRWACLLAALGAAYIDLVPLHGPDGRVYINPAEISTLREPSAISRDTQHFPRGTHCVIVTTNGKYVPVQETCSQVHALASGQHS